MCKTVANEIAKLKTTNNYKSIVCILHGLPMKIKIANEYRNL